MVGDFKTQPPSPYHRDLAPGRPAVAHHRGAPARPPRHPFSPDPSDIQAVRRWLASRARPTAIDLFSGAGGLSLGLDQAGFDVLVGADSDMWAMETHGANLPGLTWCGDLTDPADFLQTLDVWGVESVDLVAGGVPCQPFSRAGRPRMQAMVANGERSSHDARADLWSSFAEVVSAVRPRAVLVENVPDLPRWNDGAVLTAIYESLRELGYAVEAKILDGFRYGVPQHRQRLILIGLLRGGEPSWPEPGDEFVSLRDAIGDLPIIPRAQRTEELPYDGGRRTSLFQRDMREGLTGDAEDVIWDHICRDVRPDDMEAFSLLSEGQTYVDLPERLRRYRSDVFTDKYKRLSWSELCRSITAHIAKDGYWYIHPNQHRTLSIREAARVQTFPDSFRFAGTQTHRYRQIGNAVPPRLGRVVGESILSDLARPSVARVGMDSFRSALLAWHDPEEAAYPWRRGADPWHVLIAELAVTRCHASRSASIYRRLVAAAPGPNELASRPGDAVKQVVATGVSAAKARLVTAVAAKIMEHHGGEVPEDEMLLRELPGVGDQVCQAVRCFGFGRNAVMLDRNTGRVSARVAERQNGDRYQLRLDLHRLAGSRGPDAQFNHAVLELGRMVCSPVLPDCVACPVRRQCGTGGRSHGDDRLRPLRDPDPGRTLSAPDRRHAGESLT